MEKCGEIAEAGSLLFEFNFFYIPETPQIKFVLTVKKAGLFLKSDYFLWAHVIPLAWGWQVELARKTRSLTSGPPSHFCNRVMTGLGKRIILSGQLGTRSGLSYR